MSELAFSDWTPSIDAMLLEWRALARRPRFPLEEWGPALVRMRVQQAQLQKRGSWRAGDVELMRILGIAGDERTHSRVLAWLLAPAGRHGLGASFLADLLAYTGKLDLNEAAAAEVRREVEQHDARRRRLADVVVTTDAFTLVIENKLFADESKDQCEDLYWLWTQAAEAAEAADAERRDTHFVLLSRHGRRPWSATSDEARAAWCPLSHRWVADWLAANLDRISSPVARSTAIQYLITLRSVAGRPS